MQLHRHKNIGSIREKDSKTFELLHYRNSAEVRLPEWRRRGPDSNRFRV